MRRIKLRAKPKYEISFHYNYYEIVFCSLGLLIAYGLGYCLC